jgi:hypothetical protein
VLRTEAWRRRGRHRRRLRHLGEGFVHTAKVQARSCVHPGFPVDIRHNAKIGREKLAAWATRELAKRKDATP